MLKILLSTLSVIGHPPICGSTLNFLPNLNLTYEVWGHIRVMEKGPCWFHCCGNLTYASFNRSNKLDWSSYNVAVAKTTTPKIGNSIHSKNFLISLEIYGTTLHWYCCHVWICAPNCYLDLINYINCYVDCCTRTCSLRQKCPNAELFLVRIFLYSDCIRRFTPNSVRIRKIRTRNNSVFGHF